MIFAPLDRVVRVWYDLGWLMEVPMGIIYPHELGEHLTSVIAGRFVNNQNNKRTSFHRFTVSTLEKINAIFDKRKGGKLPKGIPTELSL